LIDKGGKEIPEQKTQPEPGAGEIAVDFGKSLVQSAVISPVWNGLGQLASGGRLPQVSIVNEENAQRSSADAWAQKIGGAGGMAVDFFLMSLASKGCSAEAAASRAVSTAGVGEASMARLGQGLKTGAIYGALFVPSGKDDNLVVGRLKNAAVNGITFGALNGLSEAVGSIGVLGKIKPSTLAFSVKDIAVTGAVGLPAGAIGAESDALINHRTLASWKDIKSQATDYGVIGVALTTLTHGAGAMAGSRSSSLPLARQEVQTGRSSTSLGAMVRAASGGGEATSMPALAGGVLRGGPREVASGSVQEMPKPVSTVLHDTPVGRVQVSTYADKTVVEHHLDIGIKVTDKPDGTKITESKNGVRTERPDGSETNVTSYRTESRSAEGKWRFEYNRWAKAWENWDDLGPEEKSQALTDMGQIPRGGNLVANLVEKGMGESDPALPEKALHGIRLIDDPEEQVNQWSLARNYQPQFGARLIDMLPDLLPGSRQRILSGHGASMGDVYNGLIGKHVAAEADHPAIEAAYDYLDMVQDFPKSVRKSIWDSLNDSLDPDKDKFDAERLKPLAQEIMTAFRGGDSMAKKAFQEFADRPTANLKGFDNLSTDAPARQEMRIAAPKVNEQIAAEIKETLIQGDQARESYDDNGLFAAWAKAGKLLAENSDVGLHKMIFQWGREQESPFIKDFMDKQMSPVARTVRLRNEFIRLTQADPLPEHFNLIQSMEAPFALAERAAEYHISDDQVRATLENTVQLMQIADANRDASGNLTRAGNQFRMAGLQTMVQAGDPYIVVQGSHNTCAMAQLEFSTFMKNPDEASRLVNEVMRTGKYKTVDGSTIKIDPLSLRPEDASLELNHVRSEQNYSYRSYVSQIFQTTAANIHWQRRVALPDGTPVKPGSVKYHIEYPDSYDQNGNYIGKQPSEALLYHSPHGKYLLSDCPLITDLNQLVDIGGQLAGERTTPSVTNSLPGNEADFAKYLASLPYPEAFPLIMAVDATPLSQPGATPGPPNHAISIVSPFQGGKLVYFHNTWLPGDPVANALNRYRFWEISAH
jgi:hypothetical protein